MDKENYYVRFKKFNRDILVASLNSIKELDNLYYDDTFRITSSHKLDAGSSFLKYSRDQELDYFEALYYADIERTLVLQLNLKNSPNSIGSQDRLDVVILREHEKSPESCLPKNYSSYTLYKCAPHAGKYHVLNAATLSISYLLDRWLNIDDDIGTTDFTSRFVDTYWPYNTYLRDAPLSFGQPSQTDSPSVFPNVSGYYNQHACYQSSDCVPRHSSYDVHLALERTTLRGEKIDTINGGFRSAAPFLNQNSIRWEFGFNVFNYDDYLNRWYEKGITGMYVGLYAPKYTENISRFLNTRIGGLLSFDLGFRVGWGNWFHGKQFASFASVAGIDLNFVYFRIFAEYQRKYINFKRDTRFDDGYADSISFGIKLISF